MTIRKANASDIDELVRLRIMFLNGVNGREATPEGFEGNLREYFEEAMAADRFVSFVAEEAGRIVATSGLSFMQKTPNYSNPTGREAFISNMFTLPEYRRQGLAARLFERVIAEARARGYQKISLHATEEGRKVYERFGFVGMGDEMVLNFPLPAACGRP